MKDQLGVKAAPAPLHLIQAFVNTSDVESRREDFTSPESLALWLVQRRLLAPDVRANDADLRQALELREAIRRALFTNNGASVAPEATAVLNRCARSAQMSVIFSDDGTGRVESRAPGVDGALGRLLAIMTEAMADGSWQRLKRCREEQCGWAFFDRSKNRSGAWCAMDVCGNRTKARAYRHRHVPGAQGRP